jgi:hypothetical protein
MKTIKTEKGKQQIVTGFNENRNRSLNYGQEKYLLVVTLILLFIQLNAKVNENSELWQYTISTGVHSFYAPVENLNWDNPGFAISGGINRLMGQKQLFAAGLQLQYGQNKYQGNATNLQVLGQFLPVILKTIELGIGTGIGYRFSGYPSQPLKSNGDSWEEGKNFKGIVQVPLQLSAGFRSILFSSVSVTPFFSYQLQAMFGYNPDFDPLPDSSFMIGFKFKFNNN